MRLYSWNVNGIRSLLNKGLLRPFLKSHQPDLLCLQETKAERGQIEIDLPDYHEYWNSAVKKGYSGTAIFSKQLPMAVTNGFPADFSGRFKFADELQRDSAEEGRVISAEFERYFVVTVYTPNTKDDLSRLALRFGHWDPAFLAYCQQLEARKPVILCGDLNVAHTELDLAHPKSNRGKKGFTDEERRGFQNLLDAGFIDTLRLFKQGGGHYTWWSPFSNARARNVGWRIDYVLVSKQLRAAVKAADVHPDVMGSDHCPVSITLELSAQEARLQTVGATPSTTPSSTQLQQSSEPGAMNRSAGRTRWPSVSCTGVGAGAVKLPAHEHVNATSSFASGNRRSTTG